MKNLSKGLAVIVFPFLLFSCNKNEAGKGEKENGIYYNERTDKNGSSDTTAATHQDATDESGQHNGVSSDSITVE